MISIKNVTKYYDKFKALDNVSIEIPKGSIHGLIGENGAGKTTFMRMVCGLAAPTDGSLKLFGSDDLEQQRYKMDAPLKIQPSIQP